MAAVMDIRMESWRKDMAPEWGITVGILNDNVQRKALTIMAGQRVFVCSNLMILGENLLAKRKHTSRTDLFRLLEGAIQTLKDVEIPSIIDESARRHDMQLSRDDGHALLLQAAMAGVLPARLLVQIAEIRDSSPADAADLTHAPDTQWSLDQAVTRVLRDLPINRQIRLSKAWKNFTDA